jgi:hypothetical protein
VELDGGSEVNAGQGVELEVDAGPEVNGVQELVDGGQGLIAITPVLGLSRKMRRTRSRTL